VHYAGGGNPGGNAAGSRACKLPPPLNPVCHEMYLQFIITGMFESLQQACVRHSTKGNVVWVVWVERCGKAEDRLRVGCSWRLFMHKRAS